MHPTYGHNNNPNQEVVVDVDVDADEPMIPTQTPLLNDELGSPNCEYFDVDADADADAQTFLPNDELGSSLCEYLNAKNDICPHGRLRNDNEDALGEVEDAHYCNHCKKAEERQLFLKTDLYKATLKGDWKTAKSIFDRDPLAVRSEITDDWETALETAITAKQTAFVEKLVKLLRPSDLTSSAFVLAAASGELRIAQVLVEKNPGVLNIYAADPDPIPVSLAVIFQRKDIALFLFSKTDFEALNLSQQTGLLVLSIINDYYDMALKILKKNPQLAKERDKSTNKTALHLLAMKAEAIGSRGKLSFWKSCIKYGLKGLYNKALMQTLAHLLVQTLWDDVVKNLTKRELLEFISTPSSLLDDAASVGNVEFLVILINSYPNLILTLFEGGKKTIFHTAIENRQESVFSLINEIGVIKSFKEYGEIIEKNWNMLFLAGKIADPIHLNRVSGAALQMQRELSWFKEVKETLHPYLRERKYCIKKRDGKIVKLTPRQLFTKEHKQLLKDGEEWMTKTANSCMLVATLIATVVFAAAFTIPGGIDSNTGTPIFRKKDSFTIFVISDVTALVSSTTSILIFLSILTSRYTEDDFLVSLPRKLLFGMLTLFFSIVCMIVAFSATIFMVFDKAKSEILLAIIVVAIIPVCCFCVLHSKLVLDILRSTGWFGFSSKFRKRRLFI